MTTTINGRTPEEIKELLANYKNYTFSAEALYADALAYIQQLERDNADQKQFELLRAKTFAGIKKALAIDSHCKSYEGAFEVLRLYTDYFEDAQAIKEPEVVIRLHCYVLGPARHYEWKGKTFKEALARADYDITDWIKALEVEQ